MTRHLVVFAKYPRPIEVKTRLCPPLDPDQAAALARAFLLDVTASAGAVADCELTVAYAPASAADEMRVLIGPGRHLMPQEGADLGERLSRAFERLLRDEPGRVVVIGTDSPQLPPDRLREAFEALGDSDLVLGPCDDGGYYLIGLRVWHPGLLDGVRWSTPAACDDTLSGAQALGLRCALLEPDYDIDTPGDLERLRADLAKLPTGRLVHTRKVLSALMREGNDRPQP